jgi:thiol-disulfide isomerase/thioredoxin
LEASSILAASTKFAERRKMTENENVDLPIGTSVQWKKRKPLPIRLVAIGGVILVALALGAYKSRSQPLPAYHDGTWLTNYDLALQIAQRQHKKVLVDFNATWCGPCQVYRKYVFPRPEFKKATEGMILVSVDIDQNPDLAIQNSVEGIPDFRILDSDGTPLYGARGWPPNDLFYAIAKAHS